MKKTILLVLLGCLVLLFFQFDLGRFC